MSFGARRARVWRQRCWVLGFVHFPATRWRHCPSRTSHFHSHYSVVVSHWKNHLEYLLSIKICNKSPIVKSATDIYTSRPARQSLLTRGSLWQEDKETLPLFESCKRHGFSNNLVTWQLLALVLGVPTLLVKYSKACHATLIKPNDADSGL